jgi:hypothetical protein
MLSQGKELAALDFASIIGGPLVAVINAQAMAAHVTTSFIQNIAFEPPQAGAGGGQSTKLKVVSFDFTQLLGTQAQGLQDATSIKVPLLTLVPIPFIRVDSMTIDFNVTLHDVQKTTLSNDFTFNASVSGSESSFFGMGPSVSMQTSVTDRNTYQNEQTVDDTYSLHITVHAVQDQMPGGMSQILNIFSNVIQSQSTLIQTIMTAQIQAQQAKVQQQLNPQQGSTKTQ